jgi:hypothetical protein
MQVKTLLLASIVFYSCASAKNLNIIIKDSVNVSIPVIVPTTSSISEFSDSALLTLTPGKELTRETDSTKTIVYRDSISYIIKTIFKPRIIYADTIIRFDTVFTVKVKDCEEKKEISLLDKVKHNFVLSLVVFGLFLILIIIIIKR